MSYDNPGFVEFYVEDFLQKRHVFEDKEPVVSAVLLSEDAMPATSMVECHIIKCWTDAGGNDLVRVNMDMYLACTFGEFEFDVLVDSVDDLV